MKRKKAFSVVEIIMSVALLSIFSVVFINLFVAADRLNNRAEILDMSVITATGIMERVKTTEQLTELLNYDDLSQGFIESEEGSLSMYLGYDKKWNGVDFKSNNAKYQLVLTETQVESSVNYVLSIYNGELSIYELEVVK